MNQLHRRNCFTPISIAEMTPIKRKRAQQALMFISEKHDETIKGRMVYKESQQENGYRENTHQAQQQHWKA
jgi:hypothetical protein